jgi:hypothetical protein
MFALGRCDHSRFFATESTEHTEKDFFSCLPWIPWLKNIGCQGACFKLMV